MIILIILIGTNIAYYNESTIEKTYNSEKVVVIIKRSGNIVNISLRISANANSTGQLFPFSIDMPEWAIPKEEVSSTTSLHSNGYYSDTGNVWMYIGKSATVCKILGTYSNKRGEADTLVCDLTYII